MTVSNELSPLDVLLHAMQSKWQAGDHDGAVAIARAAAPYVHARRRDGASLLNAESDLHRIGDAELTDQLAEARRRVFDQATHEEQSARMGD